MRVHGREPAIIDTWFMVLKRGGKKGAKRDLTDERDGLFPLKEHRLWWPRRSIPHHISVQK